MVGAGVLAMPYNMGTLGWIGGVVALIFFWGIQIIFAQLLASVYRVDGVYHPRYFEARTRRPTALWRAAVGL
jgi:amino acid permease